MPAPVIIYPYDSKWPKLYEVEKLAIQKALGKLALSIDHIGSTAVPGLPSKNIVDIIVGVESQHRAEICQRILIDIGYNDITIEDHPEWFFCIGKQLHGAFCHLHLVHENSIHHQNHLIFRDWLRTHPEDAESYRVLKVELSQKFQTDRVSYTNGKNNFIVSILTKARYLKKP